MWGSCNIAIRSATASGDRRERAQSNFSIVMRGSLRQSRENSTAVAHWCVIPDLTSWSPSVLLSSPQRTACPQGLALALHRVVARRPPPPTRAAKPPAGPDWVHEIKHAAIGCRCAGMATRCGCARAAATTGAAARHRLRSMGGSGGHRQRGMLYAFDLLELDGKDRRDMPLGDRKKQLRRLGRVDKSIDAGILN
jgi:hypothetical protein